MSKLTRILCEKKSHVCRITLNRPEKMNALDRTTSLELDSVITDLAKDGDIRVTILSGAGKAFCAGADIGAFLTGEIGRNTATSMINRHLLRTIESCPQIVIFQLHGYVLGGGLELALAGDLRIASEDAEFAFPEAGIGLIPGSGGTQRLPRVIGVPKAKEMIFLGRRIKAPEAERIGLVHSVVPKDKLESHVDEIANELLKKAPVSLAAAKTAINSVWDYSDLEAGLLLEKDLANLCSETHDRQEGLRAFMEKRPPNFSGF